MSLNKEKMIKKRKSLRKRKQNEEIANFSEEDEIKEGENFSTIVINESTEGITIQTSLDTKIQTYYELTGKKGHTNYYSKQNMSQGLYYFEVDIISLDYNIHEYINNKRTDEFSKKYYENILQNIKAYLPNVRIGLINSNGDLDLTIGAEKYSYAYRADGVIINDGEYVENNSSFSKGDCIGALIHLKPPRPDFLKNLNVENSGKNIECYIKFYKNGIEQKEAFIGIFEGSYHAAVTLYNFAKVCVNFGPNFKYIDHLENRNIKSFCDIEV
jgi:hypothetical protein